MILVLTVALVASSILLLLLLISSSSCCWRRDRKPTQGAAAPAAEYVYGLDHARLNLELNSLWLNLGLWDQGVAAETQTFADACRKLAATVARDVINDGDRVFDFGSGCGDQLLFWRQLKFNLSISSVTFEQKQAEIARARLQDSDVAVYQGDAARPETWRDRNGIEPRVDWSSFDVAISLDACYHFKSRKDWFRLCRDLLKPGGALTLSDIVCGTPRESRSLLEDLLLRFFCSVARVPMENMVELEQYRRDLEDAGFTDISIVDVSDQVFPGFVAFLQRHEKKIGSIINGWTQYKMAGLFFDFFYRRKTLIFLLVKCKLKS